MRIPITCIPKAFVSKGETIDAITGIIAKSFAQLALGVHMGSRWDGEPWHPSDRARRKAAGESLGCKGLLVEVRGDWAMLKQTFRFPQWNEKAGCCIKCRATPATYKDTSTSAPWRAEPLSTAQVLRRMQEQGLALPPLFACPALETSCFKEDWLHTADLGVTLDFLGNLFWLLLPKMGPKSRPEQIKALFLAIQAWYKEHPDLPGKLDHLTEPMLRKTPMAPPRLKAYGAEARGLVGFGKWAAHHWLNTADPFEQAVVLAADALAACYSCLSHGQIFAKDLLKKHSLDFANLLVALEARADPPLWRVKPKLHLFQHMCELSTAHPREAWTYRDEDFGGYLAALSRSHGGRRSHVAVAKRVLLKFAANFELPAL